MNTPPSEKANKLVVIIISLAIIMAGGIIYQKSFRPPEVALIKPTGNSVTVNVRVLQNQWKWEPNIITVQAGTKVTLKIFNEDTYDHGFGLEAFGINKRLLPKQETIIDFVASKKGNFNFYCSVPCGEGHYRQTGHFIVTD
ncbi:cupredoxin domain-containing protein [Candidatus Azambacteria bacterium]|nr:cupredoxin domain-containing protein [Candidatus Azambacteria bacterium]